jgi:thiamine-phosphate pyrophosphorylase
VTPVRSLLEPPIVCMITDRRRLAPGSSPEEQARRLVAQVSAAARAGVTFVQLRERDLEGGFLLKLSRACLEAVRGTGTRLLVNDRLDVALAADAHGVHLRADSCAAGRVRPVVPPGFVLSRAVHSKEEAGEAAGEGVVDFLVFGTVFATDSKAESLTPAGLGGLGRAAAAAGALPVLAVGGVTEARLGDVSAAGAAGFAAIGLFLPEHGADDEALLVGARRVMAAARTAFV